MSSYQDSTLIAHTLIQEIERKYLSIRSVKRMTHEESVNIKSLLDEIHCLNISRRTHQTDSRNINRWLTSQEKKYLEYFNTFFLRS